MVEISERQEDMPDLAIGKLLKIAVEDKSVISLGPGEPDFPAHPQIVEFTKKFAGVASHYSPVTGRAELKEQIVKKVRKLNKIHTTTRNVFVSCGSQEAMTLATACTMDVNDQAIVPNPSFMAYIPMFEMFSTTPYLLPVSPENNFEFDIDQLQKSITNKTKVIMINTPANPTGAVWRKSTLKAIADIAVDKNLLVFSDEAYEDIIYDREKHISFASIKGAENNAVSFFSFSKSYAMCGYRIGYAIGPEKLIKEMGEAHIYSTICAPTLSQMVATEALKMDRTYIKYMVNEYNRRRKMLYRRLVELGFKVNKPKGAFYAFPSIKKFSNDSKQFAKDLLLKAKVAVIPGVDFGPNGEGFVRMSYATDYDLIEEAMNRVSKFLKKYYRNY